MTQLLTPGCFLKRNEARGHRTACTRMLIAAVSVIAKRWKDSQWPSTGECPDECEHPYTGILPSNGKREGLIGATPWKISQSVLSERGRYTQECTLCDFTDMNSKTCKSICGKRNQNSGCPSRCGGWALTEKAAQWMLLVGLNVLSSELVVHISK